MHCDKHHHQQQEHSHFVDRSPLTMKRSRIANRPRHPPTLCIVVLLPIAMPRFTSRTKREWIMTTTEPITIRKSGSDCPVNIDGDEENRQNHDVASLAPAWIKARSKNQTRWQRHEKYAPSFLSCIFGGRDGVHDLRSCGFLRCFHY